MRDELIQLTQSHTDLTDNLKQHYAQVIVKAKATAEETLQGTVQEWAWKLDQKQREMIQAVDHANENLKARHLGTIKHPQLSTLFVSFFIITPTNLPEQPTISIHHINPPTLTTAPCRRNGGGEGTNNSYAFQPQQKESRTTALT